MSSQHTPHCPAVATRVDRQGARRSALPLIVLPVERRGRSRTACSRLASGPLCQSNNATRVSVPSSALPADRRRVSPVSKHTPTRRSLAGGHAGHAQAPRGAAPTITAVIAAQVGGREVRRRCRGPKEARGKNSAAEGARAAIAEWRGERAGRGVVAPSDGLLPRAATVGRRPGGQKPGDDGALDGA